MLKGCRAHDGIFSAFYFSFLRKYQRMKIHNTLPLVALYCQWAGFVHAINGSYSTEAAETNRGWTEPELDLIFAQSTPGYEPDMPTAKADISKPTNKYKGIFALENELVSTKQKQKAVKDAFVFAWEGYKKYSWGADENKPVSKGTRNSRYVYFWAKVMAIICY
jgi:hypothetical protein